MHCSFSAIIFYSLPHETQLKIRRRILLIMLVMLFGMVKTTNSQNVERDSVLEKIFYCGDLLDYTITQDSVVGDTLSRNVYMKYDYNAIRRNIALYFVPSMYPIARGQRRYEGETFGRMYTSAKDGKSHIEGIVSAGSAKKHDNLMPALFTLTTPRLYNVTLFEDLLLSPFHRDNKKFYKYEVMKYGRNTDLVVFNPRIENTQLIKGWAVVNRHNGNIQRSAFFGEYDMLEFDVDMRLTSKDTSKGRQLRLKSCDIKTSFSFLGNRVNSTFLTKYDCNKSLERTVRERHRREQAADTTKTNEKRKFADTAWDFVDEYLLSSKRTEVSKLELNMSPLFNPLHFGYSPSTGLSYKMDFGLVYQFTPQSNISFKPRLGYNFKQSQFFFTSPLRYTFSKKNEGWVEMTFSSGNRISDSRLLDIIENENIDTIDFDDLDINYFKDLKLSLMGNIAISDNVKMAAGVVYHHREAVNKQTLEALNEETSYNSFAPTLSAIYTPFQDGPTLSGLYQRSVKGVMNSDMEFEKFEFDASYKKKLSGLRQYSLRLGGGFYTNMKTTYFIDFVNFHQNYLPGGWEDDWEGQFQLLNSQWYNASKHYVRLNASYESPLMTLSRLPWVGRYVETERLYFSALHIEHTKPYFEVGYGFTNRYFSAGAFASIVGTGIYEFGCKLSVELFRRW